MRAMIRNSSLRATLGLMLTLALVACAAPLGQVPVTEGQPSVTTPGSSTQPELGQPGTVHLGVLWPERGYETLAIPKRTNMIRIRMQAAGQDIAPPVELTRPAGGGNVVTQTNFEIASGPERTILVTAYKDEYAAWEDAPIAQASQTLDIQPGVETNVTVTLVPTTPPIINSFALSGGPGSYLDIYGENFDFHNGPQVVRFGGVNATYIQRFSSTHLRVQVPGQGSDGKIRIEADGIIADSIDSFQIIRQIELSPATPSTTVGTPVWINMIARDGKGMGIENPAVVWSFASIPEEDVDSTIVDREFTPASTGSFTIQVGSGTTIATTVIEVVEEE